MNWTEPTDEMRAAWEQWLDENPEVPLARRFFPWAMYRLTTTGQRCQMLAFSEGGTVRVYAEHEELGPMTGVEVFGVDPNDLVPWVGGERKNWKITRTPSDGHVDAMGFVAGDMISFGYEEDA